MPDSTYIAIAGLLTTAASPLVLGRVQERSDRLRLRWERADRDLDERRELVYTAAETLTTLHEALSRATGANPKGTQALADAINVGDREARALLRRMVILLGRDRPIVMATETLLKLCDESVDLFLDRTRNVGSSLSSPEVAALADEAAAKWTALNILQSQAYDAFLDAATELVGDARPIDEPRSKLRKLRGVAS